MSRVAAGVALVLAVLCVLSVFMKVEGARHSLNRIDLAVVAVVAVAAAISFRGHRSTQVLVSVGALFLLGRSLPVYFQTSQMWPFLPVIILASVTFGFSILGILLDGFRPKGRA